MPWISWSKNNMVLVRDSWPSKLFDYSEAQNYQKAQNRDYIDLDIVNGYIIIQVGLYNHMYIH